MVQTIENAKFSKKPLVSICTPQVRLWGTNRYPNGNPETATVSGFFRTQMSKWEK